MNVAMLQELAHLYRVEARAYDREAKENPRYAGFSRAKAKELRALSDRAIELAYAEVQAALRRAAKRGARPARPRSG